MSDVHLKLAELDIIVSDLILSERDMERSRSDAITQKKIDDKITNLLSLCNKILNIRSNESVAPSDIKYVKFIKSVCVIKKPEIGISPSEAVDILKELGYDDYWIYKQQEDKDKQAKIAYEKLYLDMIVYNVKGMDEKFDDTDFAKDDNHIYKKIYDLVFQIMDELLIKESNIKESNIKESNINISHYTTKEVAEKLIFENSKLRMCSAATVNDSSEGQVVYDYFDTPKLGAGDDIYGRKEQCFISCFTFDPDCLNHFRLYGKEKKKEATGVSLTFNTTLFIKTFSNQMRFISKKDYEESFFSPLFRCLYICPESKKIVSIAHSELNETERELKEKKIKKLTEILYDLEKLITDLYYKYKGELADKRTIVSQILLNIRYIVKHAGYREEQESRLFTIKKLQNARDIHFCKYARQMYIECDFPIMENLKLITFAPKTSEFMLFTDRLEQINIPDPHKREDKIACLQSKMPLN